MAKAVLRIADDYLRRALSLPNGTEFDDRTIELGVSHPDIPEGTEIVEPIFHRDMDTGITFESWNPKKR